jgi:hypothetical protein
MLIRSANANSGVPDGVSTVTVPIHEPTRFPLPSFYAVAGELSVTATAANNTNVKADANSLHCRCMSCLLPLDQLKLASLDDREANLRPLGCEWGFTLTLSGKF